jgi:uncharacterized membrane protein
MIYNRGKFGLFKRNRIEPDRPFIRPEMGPVDWLIEAVAMVGVMILAGYVIYHFPKLPGTIPTHFNEVGLADEFGDKKDFLVLPGVAIFIYVLLTFINRVPHIFHYPCKITPSNALRQYTLATRMIRILKSTLIWMFFYISFATVLVIKKTTTGLGVWFIPVFIALLFIPVCIYFAMALKRG